MTLIAIVAAIAAVALVAGLAKGYLSGDAPSQTAIDPGDDPYALSQTDPVEALNRYGVPETYDQLLEQGIDLRGLGYEPPAER